jgi:hypothetical protein
MMMMGIRHLALSVALLGLSLVVLMAQSARAETPTPTGAAASGTPEHTPTPQASGTPSRTPTPIAGTMVIRIPAADLDLEFDVNPARNTGTKIYERISAFVDGHLCASADLRADRSNGFVPLVVGLPAQPQACRREGATISFAFGRDAQWPLQASLVLRLNTTVVFERLEIHPPQTGSGGVVSEPQPVAFAANESRRVEARAIAGFLAGIVAAAGIWLVLAKPLRPRH